MDVDTIAEMRTVLTPLWHVMKPDFRPRSANVELHFCGRLQSALLVPQGHHKVVTRQFLVIGVLR